MLIIPPLFSKVWRFWGMLSGLIVGDIDILNPVTNDFIALMNPKFWVKAPIIMAIKLPINIVITGLTPLTLATSTNTGGINKNILKLENTNLGLSKIYEDYQIISGNMLDLKTFIEESQKTKLEMYEENNQIVLEIELKEDNPYIRKKRLYIDKSSGVATKMEIEDNNKNIKIHILYTEEKINTLS